MKKVVVKLVKVKLQSTEQELFGFELSVFESVSSRKNISVPVKIFQFQDMGNENRFLGTFRGHSKRPMYIVAHFLQR
jgi:hypothetical protein